MQDMEEFDVSDASKKTKTIYISTIFSITLVLLMLGMLGLILVHAKNLSNYVKENIVLNIIVDEGAKETDVLQFQKELNANPAIKQTQYVNKELAARNLTQDLGEDFVNFLGYNPLLSTVDVYLKADYANNKSIEALKATIGKNPVVKEVIYQSSLIDMVNHNINAISIVILAFAAILLVISVALINNTIRLAIFSQEHATGGCDKKLHTPAFCFTGRVTRTDCLLYCCYYFTCYFILCTKGDS
jgi:cell division transport system permease protein